MSFQKIVTYSTALIFTCATSLFIDAQTNQVSALSDRCLTSVHEVTMALNKKTAGSHISNYPVFFPSHIDVDDTWVNAPSGKVMHFGVTPDLPEKYRKKVSTEIINNCKGTVAVQFTTCLEQGCDEIYGIVKGKVVKFKYPGCTRTNSTVNGAFNRYGKLNWGYTEESPLC
jgi:hypothetical protein